MPVHQHTVRSHAPVQCNVAQIPTDPRFCLFVVELASLILNLLWFRKWLRAAGVLLQGQAEMLLGSEVSGLPRAECQDGRAGSSLDRQTDEAPRAPTRCPSNTRLTAQGGFFRGGPRATHLTGPTPSDRRRM